MKEAWLKWLSDPERRKDCDVGSVMHTSKLAFFAGYEAGAIAMREAAAKVALKSATSDDLSLRSPKLISSAISAIDPATLGKEG